jgi:monovalent cation:proton antiporter-2 (CPA2) family protein
MNGGFLFEAFVYLAAAVAMVPLARRLGLGSVLGYLITGVVIGPYGLRLLGGGEGVMHVAEFGVVMMLFVIGLELEPSTLWRLRGPILGMGGLQVLLSALVLGGGAALLGLGWQASAAIGMTLALSSTAIVLQTLAEKGTLKTAGGQSAFSVLLFQDIAVIPMLALFPILGASVRGGEATTAGGAAHGDAHTWVSGLPGWAQTLAVLAAVALVVLGGRYAVGPLFRALARTRLREIFTAAALLLVTGIALLMTQVGLSPALGTFLAGVVLANSEYRHELESDIEPFKGLLLGLFFIGVGASVDFGLVAARPLAIAGLVVGIIALKLVVLFVLARAFRLARDQALLVAFALPQVGEFAFVLLAFGAQAGVFGAGVARPLVAVVALTMALTPLLILLGERVVLPRFGRQRTSTGTGREADVPTERGTVLIAGFGDFGSTVGRLLRANGVPTTVLDIDSDRVDLLRSMGMSVYYGDATRIDLLHAAGAERARAIVVALDTPERTLALVQEVQRHFPHLAIMARAFDWTDAHELLAAGVPHVYRESLDTAVRLGTDALHLLGFRAHAAHRAGQRFVRHDEESMRELTALQRGDDQRAYVGAVRRRIEQLEAMLRADLAERDLDADGGWDPESLREEARSSAWAPPAPAKAGD